ncbi:MAG: cyclic nucleotide-binding domain-containing protein [Xenococcaceae cyanobacterium]
MTDLINLIRDFLLSDAEFSQKMEWVQLTDGEILFAQGDRETDFYLIKSGQIKIYTCERDGQEISLNTLGAGATLGEMALIDERSHTVNAVSLGSSILLRFSRDDFWQLGHQSPELSQCIIRLLSQRIHYLLVYIANIRDWIQQIIAGEYNPAIDSMEAMELESDRSYFSTNLLVAATESLTRMVQTVRQIKESQVQQGVKLKLEIDKDKYQQQLKEIVSADYFNYLVELAERRNTVSNTENSGESKDKVLLFNKSRIDRDSKVISLENPEIKQALIRGLKNRSEVFNRLILKSWEDEQFKQKLLTNPRAVYAQEFGCQLPDNLIFEVVEETLDAIKITLPVNPFLKIPETELSEEILDALGGGNWTAIKDIFNNSEF